MKDPLSDAIDSYLLFRRSQSLSKGTLKTDQGVLRRFLATTGNIYTESIKEYHVTRHFEEAARTRSPGSLRNDHQALLTFFKWARHTKRMPVDSDPMYGRKTPKSARRERYRIPVSKFDHMLDLAGQRDPRDRAVVSVLLYTLLRDSEATALRVRDLDLDNGYVMARIHKSSIEDRVPISAELDRELHSWLTIYAESVGGLLPHYYLLPSRVSVIDSRDPETGAILSNKTLAYSPERRIYATGDIVKRVLADLGVPLTLDGKSLHEGAHTLRRSGARALFDSLSDMGYDKPLRVVQAMLHHKSQVDTERYIGITADRRSRDELIRGQVMYGHGGANDQTKDLRRMRVI